jgi:hypothetical protein
MRDTSVGIVTRLLAGWPRNRGSIPGRDFSLPHNVQTGIGAHPAFYTMGTGGPSAGGNAAGPEN